MNPWLYVQSTGELYRPDGSWCSTGYSGRESGINNPELQQVRNEGPIPVGFYTIGEVDEEKGPFTIHLIPDPANTMFQRSGFLMHGDNANLNHTASEGCIIQGRLARVEVAADKGNRIRVIARPAPQPVSI